MDKDQKLKQDDSQKMQEQQFDGKTSLGVFDQYQTYDQAFNEAHAIGGPGHTFSYQGMIYSTNRSDGQDLRRVPDNQSATQHKISEIAHQADAVIKEKTGIHVQDYLTGKGKEWSAEEDRQKEKYHQIEGQKLKEKEKEIQKEKELEKQREKEMDKEKERIQQMEKEKEKEKGTS